MSLRSRAPVSVRQAGAPGAGSQDSGAGRPRRTWAFVQEHSPLRGARRAPPSMAEAAAACGPGAGPRPRPRLAPRAAGGVSGFRALSRSAPPAARPRGRQTGPSPREPPRANCPSLKFRRRRERSAPAQGRRPRLQPGALGPARVKSSAPTAARPGGQLPPARPEPRAREPGAAWTAPPSPPRGQREWGLAVTPARPDARCAGSRRARDRDGR